MVAWHLATFWLALIASAVLAGARTDLPRESAVVVDELEVMTEPNDSAYSTGVLRSGDRVVVLGAESGWARIRAPIGTFAWINAADLQEGADGTSAVGPRPARVCFAAAGARLPGPPCRSTPPGTSVQLLDRPDLRVQRGGVIQTWRAIQPDRPEVRYLRLEGLKLTGPAQPEPTHPPERLVSHQPEGPDPDLPAEVNAELASITAMNRSIKSESVENWDLAPVRVRYEALLRRYDGHSGVRAVVQPRLDQAVRDHEIGIKAQEFARLLRAGDDRDAEVAQIQRSAGQARTTTDRKFDAQGLLQPSSRRYRGQKVHALIGPEGKPISYLTIPPGLPINRFLARKVGVRGIVHFDEGLGARLISVRDLEVIEKVR